jgi:microcystin-dependent protein
MPAHTHNANGSTASPSQPSAQGNVWCSNTANPYNNQSPNTTMNPAAITNPGGNQPHANKSPYLVLSFCIALQGDLPIAELNQEES